MKKFAIIFVMAGFCLCSFCVFASSERAYGAGGPFFGFRWPNIGKLNDKLEGYGYAKLPCTWTIMGGQGFGVIVFDGGTAILHGGGGGGGYVSSAKDGKAVKIEYGGGSYRPAYGWASYGLFAGFEVTIGGIGFDMTVVQNEKNAADEIFQNPGQAAEKAKEGKSKIEGGGLSIGLGVNVHYMPSNFGVSLDAGIILSPGFKWKAEVSDEIVDIPPITYMPYLDMGLIFGGGSL